MKNDQALKLSFRRRDEDVRQSAPLEPAEIIWDENESPRSAVFNDIYYSKEGGLAECEHVFLRANNLPEAWKGRHLFVIGELGFGLGINFLVTLRRWVETSDESSRLIYIACEKHPVNTDGIERALKPFAELKSYSSLLLSRYPYLVSTYHLLEFAKERVSLLLYFGDVLDALQKLNASVDCWYLDGFSPAKNPKMWEPEVLENVARCSRFGARLSTYSVSRIVRDNLKNVGFKVNVMPGFGKKKEMLSCKFTGGQTLNVHDVSGPAYISHKPRHERVKVAKRIGSVVQEGEAVPEHGEVARAELAKYVHSVSRAQRRLGLTHDQIIPHSAIVIGGGLSGIAAAYSLSQRNIQVTIIEREENIAEHASGNIAGVIMPYLSAEPDLLGRFYLAAYCHAVSRLRRLASENRILSGAFCGVLRLCTSRQIESVMGRLALCGYPAAFAQVLSQQEASERAGVLVDRGGLFFPGGGWVNPESYCRALLAEARNGIKVINNRYVADLRRDGQTWIALDEGGRELRRADIVVIATAHECKQFVEVCWLPLEKVRGQTVVIRETDETRALQVVVCYEGYILPAIGGTHLVGATYEHANDSTAIDLEKEELLLNRLCQRVLSVNGESLLPVSSRVAFRTMSPDRLPLIGYVPDLNGIKRAYVEVNGGRFGKELPLSHNIPGMFVSVGHGSRGLLSCAFAGEIIAALACGEPVPIENDLLQAISPTRFPVRAIRRGLFEDLLAG